MFAALSGVNRSGFSRDSAAARDAGAPDRENII